MKTHVYSNWKKLFHNNWGKQKIKKKHNKSSSCTITDIYKGKINNGSDSECKKVQ